ncbi:MAG: hypothetical protein R3C18_10300 [Planctomycetaceae bacterium]
MNETESRLFSGMWLALIVVAPFLTTLALVVLAKIIQSDASLASQIASVGLAIMGPLAGSIVISIVFFNATSRWPWYYRLSLLLGQSIGTLMMFCWLIQDFFMA